MSATPFARVIVPFDGSETASAALSFGIGLAAVGAELIVINVVDELAVMQASNEGPVPFDRTPLSAALDMHGRSVLEAAKRQAQAAQVIPELEIVHDIPVVAIARTAQTRDCDLIVMGTHARTGLSRLFLGSTTDGVLRASEIPVLTVSHPMPAGDGVTWRRVLVAVDDSDPADAALRLAGQLVGDSAGGFIRFILCHAADTLRTREMAAMYGFDPTQFIEEQCIEARAVVERAAARAELAPGAFEIAVVEGEAAAALATAASDRHADLIVIGSHGRRGLQRLILGSVAEHVVRSSPVPVLVVRK